MKPRQPDIVILSRFIADIGAGKNISDNWETLLSVLEEFGFDRILYGKKMYPNKQNLHNHSDTILLSTYGPSIVEGFLTSRLYMDSPTINWAMKNYGAISWGEVSRWFEAGELTDSEAEVFLKTREMGLSVGYTYSTPVHKENYRSAFGLSCSPGKTQAEVDAIWTKNGSLIESILSVFDIANARFVNVPEGQELDPRTLYFMSLVAEGRSLQEIAEREGCHYRTIDKRLAKARAILGANNTLHAVLLAKEQGQL